MPKIVDREAKKREIVDAALEIFTTKGLHEATVEEIAKKANMGKGTFYHYFESKEEIVLEIWDTLFDGHDAWMETVQDKCQSETERILNVFDFNHFDRLVMENAFKLYSVYLASIVSKSRALFSEYKRGQHQKEFETVKNYLRAGIDSGEFIEMEIETVAEIIIFIKEGLLVSAAERGLGVEYVLTTIPRLIEEFLQTIKHKK